MCHSLVSGRFLNLCEIRGALVHSPFREHRHGRQHVVGLLALGRSRRRRFRRCRARHRGRRGRQLFGQVIARRRVRGRHPEPMVMMAVMAVMALLGVIGLVMGRAAHRNRVMRVGSRGDDETTSLFPRRERERDGLDARR